MNVFQIGGLVLAAFFLLLTVAAMHRGRINRRTGAAWLLLWTAAAVAIRWPESTVVAARALGIQRGADLVFYCAILGMLAAFFAVYVRLRRIDEILTGIIRHLALTEADQAVPDGDADPPQDPP